MNKPKSKRGPSWKLLLTPGGSAKVLLSIVSIVSTIAGIVEFWRQHTAALVVTYQAQDIVLPQKLIVATLPAYGPWKFADFIPRATITSPKTTLTRLDISNRKDSVAEELSIEMPDVSRVLYASGYISSPEVKYFSDSLRIDHSTNTLLLKITGISDMPPAATASIFIWADTFNFGLAPIKVRSKAGAARVGSGSYVTGVARVFAYCMVWCIAATLVLALWQLFVWLREGASWD